MKITDVEVITFKVPARETIHHRWGYYIWNGDQPETEGRASITKISTDEGVSGYYLGGDPVQINNVIKPMLVGEDAWQREKYWNMMDQIVSFGGPLSPRTLGVVDCALWDLAGRALNQPVYKLLGGAREKVKAYASTYPNMGKVEDYIEHALKCKEEGYTAYKIHGYICWDPHKWQPAPQLPGFPKEDIEICRAVRDAVGGDMVLMLDPFGVYTLEQSLWVGRELEKLNFYWLEHPMIETRMEPYRRLTKELSINICSPEHVEGGVFARAEWLLQGACDMLRIDAGYGGLSGCWKAANLCQAYGLKLELHGGGWAHNQIFGATLESTCEYYERGLLRKGLDYDKPAIYLKSICDPLDQEGNVILPKTPGLGMEFDWDYIDNHRV